MQYGYCKTVFNIICFWIRAVLKNNLSTGAEDTGVDKESLSIATKFGKTPLCLFHKCKISSITT